MTADTDDDAMDAMDDQVGLPTPDEVSLVALGWAPWLAQAAVDPLAAYAIGLRSGLVVLCGGVQALTAAPGWVQLVQIEATTLPDTVAQTCTFPRGLQVRLSEIAWIADAPMGSR